MAGTICNKGVIALVECMKIKPNSCAVIGAIVVFNEIELTSLLIDLVGAGAVVPCVCHHYIVFSRRLVRISHELAEGCFCRLEGDK